MLIAQISDPHVLDDDRRGLHGVDNNRRLSLAIESINAEQPRPDAVVVTGDLTMDGTADQYRVFKAIFEDLQVPYMPIGGNHDDRDRLKETFTHMDWADAKHASWSMVIDGLRIVGLDSTVPGDSGARIGPKRAEWLSTELAGSSEPVLLAMHHPPFLSGIDWMDRFGFSGLDRFISTLESNTRPGLIICGHLHRPIHSAVAGVRASIGLSTIQHVALDLGPDAPPQIVLGPVGYQLHALDNGSWVSHTRYIDTNALPFPFDAT